MLAVRMRKQHGVDAVHAGAAQKRHDDAFSHGFRRAAAVGSAFEAPARVDQQCMAERRLDHDAVGLADIQYGDAQMVISAMRRRYDERRTCKDQRTGGGACFARPTPSRSE